MCLTRKQIKIFYIHIETFLSFFCVLIFCKSKFWLLWLQSISKKIVLKKYNGEYNDVPGHPLSTVMEEGYDAALAPVN